jgi:hypothetical protein
MDQGINLEYPDGEYRLYFPIFIHYIINYEE